MVTQQLGEYVSLLCLRWKGKMCKLNIFRFVLYLQVVNLILYTVCLVKIQSLNENLKRNYWPKHL